MRYSKYAKLALHIYINIYFYIYIYIYELGFFLGLMVHVYCFDIKTKTDNYITVPKISQKKDIFN